MKNPSIRGKIAGMEGFSEPPVGFEPTTPALAPDAWWQAGKVPFCPECRGFCGQRQL